MTNNWIKEGHDLCLEDSWSSNKNGQFCHVIGFSSHQISIRFLTVNFLLLQSSRLAMEAGRWEFRICASRNVFWALFDLTLPQLEKFHGSDNLAV